MDKQKLNKGFTMIEMIFVLAILAIAMLLLVTNKKPSTLYLEMLTIQNKILDLQLKALSEKEQQVIVFDQSVIYFNEESYELTNQTICEQATITFNGLGNINHANTVCCYQGERKRCIKFQLGSGRCSIE